MIVTLVTNSRVGNIIILIMIFLHSEELLKCPTIAAIVKKHPLYYTIWDCLNQNTGDSNAIEKCVEHNVNINEFMFINQDETI